MVHAVWKWVIWRPVLAVACTTWVHGCSPRNQYVPPPPPRVTVSQPLREDVVTYIEETGVTEAVETVQIRARVEGYLQEILCRDGQDVAANELLFVIDKRPFEAERNKQRAALKVAEAEKGDAEAKYRRAIPLAEKGAISQEELVEKAAAWEVAKASIEAQQAALEQAELELSYTGVTSPIAGRVGARLVDKGNFVGRGMNTHLATVISYDPIYASFNIAERDLLKLLKEGPRRGDGGDLDKEQVKFYMALEGDRDFPRVGHFDYADLGVESSTGTFRIRGVFPNPQPRLVTPGMTVRIRVPMGVLKDVLLVPESALGFDQGGRYLLVVDGQNKVDRRKVTPGQKLKTMQVISGGLRPDDWVIVDGLQRARPGSLVDPQRKALAALPPQELQPPAAPPAANEQPRPADAGDAPNLSATAGAQP